MDSPALSFSLPVSLSLSLSLMCAQPPQPIPALFSARVYAADPLLITKVEVKKTFPCATSGVLNVLIYENHSSGCLVLNFDLQNAAMML